MDNREIAAPAGTEAAGMDFQRPEHSIASAGSAQSTTKPKTLRPQSKRASLLRVFLERGERGLNCFEAVREAHDYVLRSSISDFRRSFGIEFTRRYETVPGHNGGRVDCVRYSLTPDSAAKARELLGNLLEVQ